MWTSLRYLGSYCRNLSAFLILTSLAWVEIAHADPSAAVRETARSLMDRGHERMKKNETAAALADFQGADALVGVPPTGVAVGQALEQLGRLVEARDKYLSVSRVPLKPSDPAQFRAAQALADKLQTALAARIPSIQFDVSGLPATVVPTVKLDGELVLATTLTLPQKVDPGKHRVTGNATGYTDISIELAVAEVETKTAALVFIALPKALVSTPVVKHAVPAPVPAAEKNGFSPFFWAGMGVTVVGVAAGSVTGVMSLGAASDAKANCTGNACPESERDTIDKSLLLAHVSTGSFALGGLGLAVLGFGLYDSGLFGGAKDKEAAFTVKPVVGPGSFALVGSF